MIPRGQFMTTMLTIQSTTIRLRLQSQTGRQVTRRPSGVLLQAAEALAILQASSVGGLSKWNRPSAGRHPLLSSRLAPWPLLRLRRLLLLARHLLQLHQFLRR